MLEIKTNFRWIIIPMQFFQPPYLVWLYSADLNSMYQAARRYEGEPEFK